MVPRQRQGDGHAQQSAPDAGDKTAHTQQQQDDPPEAMLEFQRGNGCVLVMDTFR